MKGATFRREIFLVSLAVILLEISYTRVFSFKLFYYFTFLTLGIVLMGLGAGGVVVSLSPALRRLAPKRLIPTCCLLAAGAVVAGYVVVASTQLNVVDLMDSPVEILKLALICTVLFVPFLLAGVVLATIFGARPAEVDRLYFADLMGAGLGCAACIPLLVLLTPPGCVVLSGAIFALAALPLTFGEWKNAFRLGALAAVGMLLLASYSKLMPDPVPDRIKTMSPQRRGANKVLFSQWSPIFRVDVVEGSTPARHMLDHDGMIGSSILAFDGDFSTLKKQFEVDPRSQPFQVIDPSPKVLIIGAAGGHEVLASLYFGAAEITAVELNPVTVSLLRDHFADYTGHIAEDSRVKLVNAEGRSFLARDRDRYDLIWFVAPDSYAAMNSATSGAFVLSESYLYTKEMIIEALHHLRSEGIICVQFGEIDFARKPNRTTRYLATAREAFRQLGTDDFGRHVLLSTTPEFFTMATILLKNTPFSMEEVRRFRASAEAVRPVGKPSIVWHAADIGESDRSGHAVNQVISLAPEALERWFDRYAYDVRPVTDDSPFFWHFARFGDALRRPWDVEQPILDPEDATGERVLLTLFAFVIVFAAFFLLLPLAAVRGVWSRVPYKVNAGIYFAALGLGFMFFEVCLIQKLTLFLGYPTYSLTVTLFALLIFTGVGSLLSGRYSARRGPALVGLLSALVVLVLGYQLGLPAVENAFAGSVLPVRIALTVAFLAPLGLCLGAFMPIGLASMASVTEFKQEYVAWCWAVNGFFSVMSSVLATMLSMTIGFGGVLVLAAIVYAVGVAALLRVPDRRASLT